jgi:hypothetical protein
VEPVSTTLKSALSSLLILIPCDAYHPVDEGDYEGEREHEQNEEDQVAGDVESLYVKYKYKKYDIFTIIIKENS